MFPSASTWSVCIRPAAPHATFIVAAGSPQPPAACKLRSSMGTSGRRTTTSTADSRTSSSAVHAANGGGSSPSDANASQPAGPAVVCSRRSAAATAAAAVVAAAAAGAGAAPRPAAAAGVAPTKEELRTRLSREEFYVTQEKGTERAFTGKYWNEKRRGIYRCVCCETPLFDSDKKYDSGTGWPSYWDQIGGNVKEKADFSIPFMPRTEVVCKTCGAHLGHVFPDGPRPTGLRYCINSAALRLEVKEG